MTRLVVDESTGTALRRERADSLTVEEPLEIRVHGRSLAVTMRTPGHDVELAAGFLLSEGIVRAPDDYAAARYCAGATSGDTDTYNANTYNVLDITLGPGVAPPDPSLHRAFTTTSSCGVCGKSTIDSVRTTSQFDVAHAAAPLDAAVLISFPDALRAQQAVFERTGGLHAAALFDTDTGELLAAREDVGRHNAVDKVIGWALMNDRLPLHRAALMVSGRASFELTQKAIMAGIPILAAVSAPSSLAVDLAVDAGLTLVGFLRDESMVIYSRPDRITTPSSIPQQETSTA